MAAVTREAMTGQGRRLGSAARPEIVGYSGKRAGDNHLYFRRVARTGGGGSAAPVRGAYHAPAMGAISQRLTAGRRPRSATRSVLSRGAMIAEITHPPSTGRLPVTA
jgi:hypothetical protein